MAKSNISALRAFAKRSGYTHFVKAERNFLQFYSQEHCEVCEDLVMAVNPIKVVTTPHEALSAGLVDGRGAGGREPEEGGYSELHECATCSACCYNENPRGRTRKDGQFVTLADGTPL